MTQYIITSYSNLRYTIIKNPERLQFDIFIVAFPSLPQKTKDLKFDSWFLSKPFFIPIRLGEIVVLLVKKIKIPNFDTIL